MSYRYVVLGAGRQGRAAAYDLSRFGEAAEVVVADRDEGQVREAVSMLAPLCPSPIRGEVVDASDQAAVARVLKDADGVLSAVPYWLNLELSRTAVATATHFADLGGNTGVVKEQHLLHEAAASAGVSICADCGLAPGLSNLIAARALLERPDATSIRIYCGGLPQEPQGPLGYHLVFAVEGLLNEYFGKAVVLRDGSRAEIDTFTELERVSFAAPLGELEACVTSGGTSTAPESFAGRLERYEYKTLRYPGHFDKFRLFKDLGFLDLEPRAVRGQEIVPRALFQTLLEGALTRHGAKDLVVLRVECEAPDGVTSYELLDYFDEDTGFSAMERTTGFPAAAVLYLQARGAISKGAMPIEQAVPSGVYFEELSRRGITLEVRDRRPTSR